jgi:hypothetical protein
LPFVEHGRQMFEVLADAGPLYMEAFWIAPEGDIPTHALGQRAQVSGEVLCRCAATRRPPMNATEVLRRTRLTVI